MPAKKKSTDSGLAAFAARRPAGSAAAPADPPAPAPAAAAPKADTVAMTVRLTDEQYRRVQELRLNVPGKTRRTASVQELVIEGLSRLFTERGLPPL